MILDDIKNGIKYIIPFAVGIVLIFIVNYFNWGLGPIVLGVELFIFAAWFVGYMRGLEKE